LSLTAGAKIKIFFNNSRLWRKERKYLIMSIAFIYI